MNNVDDFEPTTKEKFTSKEIDILIKNKKFYSANKKYVDILLEIINGESDISIRAIDWFVINYSKKNNTCYKIKINNKIELFNVNSEYQNQLNGYSKDYFDPFCRDNKLTYTYKHGNGKIKFMSSIGQLNFFRWAIRNKIINYVSRHLDEIEKDHKETDKKNKERKKMTIPKKTKTNSDFIISDDPDPIICSSDKIKSLNITPIKSSSNNKSETENKTKRLSSSRSTYNHGIKKISMPIKLDFD